MIDPGLINIDDTNPFTELVQQHLSKLLAKDKRALRVPLEGDIADLFIPKAEVTPQYLPDSLDVGVLPSV